MYETYLQNEREFEKNWEHGDIPNSFVTYKTDGSGYSYIDRKKVKSHNRLSLIKVMKALEKELEGEKVADGNYNCGEEGCCNLNPDDPREENSVDWQIGYNQALQLSLDKIREFISKLEKEV